MIEGDWGPAFSGGDGKSLTLKLTAERLQPREAIYTGAVYLSLIFLALNLAVPGSANFHAVRIRTSEETGHYVRWSSPPFEAV